MDVARPFLHCLKQDQVDEADDRRIVGVDRELLGVEVSPARVCHLNVNDALDALLDVDGVAVVLVDGCSDVFGVGPPRSHLVAGVGRDGVRGDDVQRVLHGEDKSVLFLPDGDHAEALGHLARNEPHDVRVDLHVGQAKLFRLEWMRSFQVRFPPLCVSSAEAADAHERTDALKTLECKAHANYDSLC